MRICSPRQATLRGRWCCAYRRPHTLYAGLSGRTSARDTLLQPQVTKLKDQFMSCDYPRGAFGLRLSQNVTISSCQERDDTMKAVACIDDEELTQRILAHR